jgi:hypothetical protein
MPETIHGRPSLPVQSTCPTTLDELLSEEP